MSVYYYSPSKKGWGWDQWLPLGVSELTEDMLLNAADILLIHAGDFNIPTQKPIPLHILQQTPKNHCGEIVFFSEGGCDEMCSETVQRMKEMGKPPLDCARLGIDVFGITELVHDVMFFDGFVREHALNSELKARDFFSVQVRELKPAFRLLVQTWLVATGGADDYDKEGILKALLKGPLPNKDDEDGWREFFKPVSDLDGGLHEKLMKSPRRGNDKDPDWTKIQIPPSSESITELRQWAFHKPAEA